MNNRPITLKRNKIIKIILISAVLVCITIGQFFSKKGANLLGRSILAYAYVSIGYGMLIIRGIAWINLLNKIELYKAYAIQCFSYIIIFVMSITIFHETITTDKIIGSALILVGILIINKKVD